MGLAAMIKRILISVTGMSTRAGGGTFITFVPTGAGLLGAASLTLTTNTATAWAYGAIGALIAATANTTEGWIEGLVISVPSTATKEWCVAITSATAITAAAQIEAEVPMYIGIATDEIYVKLSPPVHIPANTVINAAAAGAVKNKTLNVYAVISRSK